MEVYTANRVLNEIVTRYFVQAKENGATCTADMMVPEGLSITDSELSAIMENALHNCLKATRLLGSDGWIRITAKAVKNCLVLKITNNYRSETFEKGKGGGLPLMKSLCNLHAGLMETRASHDLFSLTMFLNLDSN